MTTPSITKFLTCTTLSKSQQLADAEVLAATPPSAGKRKRGQYSDYSPKQRLKIARYAIEMAILQRRGISQEHFGNH